MRKSISIIIPTFQRSERLIKILTSLQEQIDDWNFFEILICDSFSPDDSEKNITNFVSKYNLKKIRYLNIKKNNLSAKRNCGIENSSHKHLILIDDDCIPRKNFINFFLEDFNRIDDSTILSGVVEYSPEMINLSNYLNFRNSRHFSKKQVEEDNLIESKYFVAMNMGFIKSSKILDLGLFNENFVGYGFEDFEFAYRVKKNGFKLKQTKASILHDEGIPSFEGYLKKHFHLGRDGMTNFLKIDKTAAKETIYYKIENNIFVYFFMKIPFVKLFLKQMEKLLIKIDTSKLFYCSMIYNVARLSSYLRGSVSRNKITTNTANGNWYD
jgi:glycosyltransferase involved in cell wall biosynthesis